MLASSVKPVLAWSAFTVASVTIAPLWSYTVPEMVPREVWAKTDAANNRTILSKKEERRDGTILHLLGRHYKTMRSRSRR